VYEFHKLSEPFNGFGDETVYAPAVLKL